MGLFDFLFGRRKEILVIPVGTWEPNCVGWVILAAWTYQMRTGLSARIEVSMIDAHTDHVQAMGQKPDGEWIYLTIHTNDGLVRPWERHFPDKPVKRYVGLDEFIEEQKEHRHP